MTLHPGTPVKEAPASPFHQPKAVWAVAFACVISFMGIGLWWVFRRDRVV